MTPVEQITSLYIGYFGRAPDPEGLNYWVGRLQDGFSLAEIAESFSVQAESQTKYPYLSNPNIASPQAFITQVYMNLFNRMPDAEGLAYWTNELNNGGDVGDFILNVISGAVTNPDQQIVENKIEVGVDFALRAANEPGFVYNDNAAAAAVEVINGVDETDASVEAGKAESEDFFENGNVPGGGAVGDIFTLTAAGNVQTGGVDIVNGTANNDTIRAIIGNSLDSSDIIDGGAGQDVLNISTGGIAANAAPIIRNVETINNAGGDLDLGGVTGANRINSSADAAYTNAALGTVFAATATGLLVEVGYAGDLSGAGTTANVATDIDNAAGTAEFDFGASAADIENVNLNVSGDADDVTSVTLDADLDGLVNLTITGDGDVDLVDTFVGASDLATINASAATGNVTLELDSTASVDVTAGVSITTGSGNDTVTLAGQDDADVSLGAGNDVLNLGGVEQGLTVTLGAGTDLVVLADVLNIADATEANFASDIIRITDFNGSQDFLDLSTGTITFVALDNIAQGNIEDEADLFDAVTVASTYAAADQGVVFEFGGSTYLYVEDADAGFDAGDGLIQLVGFTGDLTAANFAG